jgi:uncharacterized membrane protein
MATQVMSWLLAIPLLGVATGCRAMTPIAALCWFAWFRLLPVEHTWAFWTASLLSVIVFTVLALGEFIGDKLPKTPSRLAPGALAARIVFGGLVGAIIATSLKGSVAEGSILGIIGAVIGAFGGYHVRHFLVFHNKCRDWPVAVLEDFCVVLITVFALRLATT